MTNKTNFMTSKKLYNGKANQKVTIKKMILPIIIANLVLPSIIRAEEFEVNAYVGAELGGNFSLSDELRRKGTFNASNMFKVGAEISKKFNDDFSLFAGVEARYQTSGFDSDFDEGSFEEGKSTDLYRFSIGIDTFIGRTEFGILEGIADVYDDYGDLSIEHGLGADFGVAINGEQTLQHIFTNNEIELGIIHDFDKSPFGIMGSFTVFEQLSLGAGFVDGGDIDSKAYTIGAVYSLQDTRLGIKYINESGRDIEERTGYAISAAYQVNDKLKLASSYNSIDFEAHSAKDDDYFTVGASYHINENVELQTDFKLASEIDDKVFVRANINF